MGNVGVDKANACIVRSLQYFGSYFVGVHVEYRGIIKMWEGKCFDKLPLQRKIK